MGVYRDHNLIFPEATVSAGGTGISSILDIESSAGASIMVKIVNGGTGPSVACKATLWRSCDNSVWFDDGSVLAGGTASSTTYTKTFYIDHRDPQFYKVIFTGNTGQSVTCTAHASVAKYIYND